MKKSLVLVILIGMMLLVSPYVSTVSAFEDSVERYDTGYTDLYTPLEYTEGSVGPKSYSFAPVQDPRGLTWNTALKLSMSSAKYGGYPFSHTCLIKPNEAVSPSYYSFNVLAESYGGYYSDPASTEYLYVRVLGTDGTIVADIAISSTNYAVAAGGSKVEIIQSGSYYNTYVDGVLVASTVAGIPNYEGDVYFCIGGKITTNVGDYSATSMNLYFDDMSDSSIIGTKKTFSEVDEKITFTWSSKLMRSTEAAQKITLYAITPTTVGNVDEWIIPTDDVASTAEFGYFELNRTSTLEENYGLYLLEMTRDDVILADTYIYYDNLAAPIGLPEVLFSAGSNVGTEIRDADNNGGIISSGGSVYLYPDNASGIYPVRYTLQGTPYSFTATLNAVYGNSLINSTPFTFGGLSNNYVVTLDGESLAGTHASGDLVFADNVTDEETVTIGSDVYEFESMGGVTGGNIQVNIGNISQTAENLTTAINTAGLSAVSSSVVETPASSAYYYSDIEITNNPGIADYQAKVTIPFETGMSTDFSNIRFFDNGVSIPYWIESKTDSTSAVVWIPISTGSDISCRWGIEGETVSESSISDVMDFGDDFNSGVINSSIWNSYGTVSVSDGIATITGTSEYSYLCSINTYGVNYVLMSRSSIGYGETCSIGFSSGSTGNGVLFRYDWPTTGEYNTLSRQSFEVKTYSAIGSGYSGYHKWELLRDGGTTNKFKIDGSYVGSNHTTNVLTSQLSAYCGAYKSNVLVDWIAVRKYAATEPTLSVGASQVSPESAPVTSVHIVSDSIGTLANSITTTETCTNAAFEAETLTGGSGGSIVNTPTWSYEITDWTNLATHIFSFSPDLTVPGVYGYVKDVSTQAAIQSATVTIVGPNSTQYVYTDENGFYYLTNGMELNEQYTVSAAKSGYTQGVSFTVSTTAGATTRKDLYMDPVASGGSGIYYSPHYVRFVVTDKYLFERYSGANVTISGTNATTTTQMTGTDGACGFEMTTSTRYAVNTVYGGVNQTDYITPTENSYYIILDATGTSLLPTSQFYETCNITITKNEVNSSHATITTMYSDTGTGTNSVYFVLGQTYENNNTLNVMETSNVGTGNMTYTFTVQDYVGEDYVIKVVVDHDSFGDVEKYYGINFPGSALPFKGNMIIALVVLVFFVVAMQWGKADAHMGAVLICGLGWWFYYLDIFEKLGSATNTVIGVGLGLATVYAVLSMINKKRDEGGI